MEVAIGTAPISFGVLLPDDPKQMPWPRYLDEVAAAGYEWTELGPYGYLPTEAKRLKKELDQRGLNVSAGYIFRHFEDPAVWPEIEKLAFDTSSLLGELDAKFLVLIDDTYTSLFTGEQYKPSILEEADWKRLIDTVGKVAGIAKGYGVQAVFHNHADSHVQYEHQVVALLEQTDPQEVSLCFDTGHFAYRGGDPIGFLRRYHERIPYLHFKSIDKKYRQKVERENIPFATPVDNHIFVEPSQGVVDFRALRVVLEEINYQGWATVEQDVYPATLNVPFPIAKRTRAFLREIGIG